MTTSLVTGATGFVGFKLVEQLLQEGHTVKAIGRNEHIGEQLVAKGAQFYRVDFSETEQLRNLCANVDYVFHCGALSSHTGTREQYNVSNVVGTQAIVDGCLHYGVKRLIHVSTPSIYFRYNTKLHVQEDEPPLRKFANEYARTKQLAEQVVDAAFAKGLPTITIRPRAIFGEGDHALMPNLFDVNRRLGVPLFYGGRALMDVTYVDNVVHALLLCMEAPAKCLGQAYNITNGEPLPLLTILQRIFAASGVELRVRRLPYRLLFLLATILERVVPARFLTLTRYTISVLAQSQTLSIEKAQQQLGYEPQISVDEGIARYGAWVKERGHWN